MKVRCIRLLDYQGKDVTSSQWLELGRIYHVLSIFVDASGQRRFWIDSQREGEWPSNAEHRAECFELVSAVIPTSWRAWIGRNFEVGIAPTAWQAVGFSEALLDHDLGAYAVFDRERRAIVQEDP